MVTIDNIGMIALGMFRIVEIVGRQIGVIVRNDVRIMRRPQPTVATTPIADSTTVLAKAAR
jgi:hypothetical protein